MTESIGIPSEIMPLEPTAPMPASPPVSDAIPDQSGILGQEKHASLGTIMFEDMFPPIVLSESDKAYLSEWFNKDLRSCVRNVDAHRERWAEYRAVYAMEYIHRFYPDMSISADYPSGVLCDKVLEGMDRMKKSIFSARPFFGPDPWLTGSDANPAFFNRAQWCLHSIFEDDLDIMNAIGDAGFFEFLIDGSLIMEADTMFEKIPVRTIRTITNEDELLLLREKMLDDSAFDIAVQELQARGAARVLVEEESVTKSGLQVFLVSKADHLIPEGVYSDKELKFRARRMYYTAADLRLMASDDVGWYSRAEVDRIINRREEYLTLKSRAATDQKAAERLREMDDGVGNLCVDIGSESDLQRTDSQPYKDTFAVYRVTAQFGYQTKSDPRGLIPKTCVVDYCPEGRGFFRAVTYPHLHERKNWFHFKLGYMPDSYYGFGYGARCVSDDHLESNALNLYMESAAMATWNPFVMRHPEAGGRGDVWATGYGPAKVGYANDPGDVIQLKLPPPHDGLIRVVLPFVESRTQNRTSVTSLTQGRTEESDPRSPAQKTAMLLGQASIGLDVMVDDWSRTGWEPLAQYVWAAIYENSQFVISKGGNDKDLLFDGKIVPGGETVPPDAENIITIEELKKRVRWKSLASSGYLNPQFRTERFQRAFAFFVPLLRELATAAPEVYKTYFLRWMQRAAQESDMPGMHFLVPTKEDIAAMAAPQLQSTLEGTVQGMSSSQAPWMQVNQKGGGGGNAA